MFLIDSVFDRPSKTFHWAAVDAATLDITELFACPHSGLYDQVASFFGIRMQTTTPNAKNAATAVLQGLPDDVSWEQLQYHLYVRQQIDLGLADSDAGRLLETSEVRERLNTARSKPKARDSVGPRKQPPT